MRPYALTNEEVNKRLASFGARLVGDWLGTKRRNELTCLAKGHKWTTLGSVALKAGCPTCFNEKRTLSAKEVNERLSPRGIYLVGKWQSADKTHRFRCVCGHQWKTKGNNPLNSKTGCPRCARQGQILTLEEINERLVNQGVRLISPWHGTGQQNRFECVAAGHQWETYGSGPVILRTGCAQCKADAQRYSTAEVNAILAPQGIHLLGEWLGTTKVHRFACDNGHEWRIQGQGPVVQKSGCAICNNKLPAKLTLEEVAARLAPRQLTLIGEWKGAKHTNRFRCSLGHEWEATGSGPVLYGSGCPECDRLIRVNRFAAN